MQQFVRRVLMAFVFFIAVATPTREVAAATIVQDQKFGLLGSSSDATVNYLLFDPSLGTLTGVDYVLTSQILEPIGATLLASVTTMGILTHVLTGASHRGAICGGPAPVTIRATFNAS
jgi:hypothetical protein